MVATVASACLLVLLVAVRVWSVQPAPKEVEVVPYILEQNLLNLLEDLRNLLKNGNPDAGIPPLDPLVLHDAFGFNFYLNDTRLEGNLGDMVFTHVSDFNITAIALNVLPGLKLTISPVFQILNVTGRYKLDGEVFGGELPIAGTGKFKSDVDVLVLNILLDCILKDGSVWIRDFSVDFSLSVDEFYYTNERDGTSWTRVDNIIEILNRVRDEYFPLVEHTLALVGSDLLVGITIEDIIDLITGHHRESLENWHQLFNKLIPMFIFNQHQ